jgi:hypothetical protein
MSLDNYKLRMIAKMWKNLETHQGKMERTAVVEHKLRRQI